MRLLDAISISKAFAGVQALAGVSFDLRPGEVHALVGENGAGKSTLIRIITGAETPDSGTLIVAGPAASRTSIPRPSRALGIAAIYQQPSLFPDLTVAENIALALETRRRLAARRLGGERRERARRAARAGRRDDRSRRGWPRRSACPSSSWSRSPRRSAPTRGSSSWTSRPASLSEREVARLFAVIARAARRDGAGIIYISHRLEEVFAIADRVTVLRDGADVATRATAGTSTAAS